MGLTWEWCLFERIVLTTVLIFFFIELTELTSDFDFIATEALIQGWGGVPVNIFWAKCTLNASLIESNHIFGFVQPK